MKGPGHTPEQVVLDRAGGARRGRDLPRGRRRRRHPRRHRRRARRLGLQVLGAVARRGFRCRLRSRDAAWDGLGLLLKSGQVGGADLFDEVKTGRRAGGASERRGCGAPRSGSATGASRETDDFQHRLM